jgi:hypothetical protein
MEPLQFCYWLQGFAEINGEPPLEAQWQAIREHLQTVFEKKTPKYIPRNTTAAPVADSTDWKPVIPSRAVC